MGTIDLSYRRKLLALFTRRTARRNLPNATGGHLVVEGGQAVQVARMLQQADIPFALIGGHAVGIYVRPRATVDIDFLVDPMDLQKAVDALGGEQVAPLAIGGVSMSVDGVPVDLVAPAAPWVHEALQEARIDFTLAKPYLVLTKLWASRGEQDDADVIALLRASGQDELSTIRSVIERHLPDQVEDLEQMIEISRMAGGSV